MCTWPILYCRTLRHLLGHTMSNIVNDGVIKWIWYEIHCTYVAIRFSLIGTHPRPKSCTKWNKYVHECLFIIITIFVILELVKIVTLRSAYAIIILLCYTVVTSYYYYGRIMVACFFVRPRVFWSEKQEQQIKCIQSYL